MIQHVDADRNTVNGYSAKISEAEIRYDETLNGPNKKYTHESWRVRGSAHNLSQQRPTPKLIKALLENVGKHWSTPEPWNFLNDYEPLVT